MRYYDISFRETCIEFTIKPPSRATKIDNFLQRFVIFILPPLFWVIVNLAAIILNKSYSFAITIISVLFLITTLGIVFIDIKTEAKRVNLFKLIINENGVTHIELKKKFHLNWNEIKTFGFVNKMLLPNSFGILGFLRINRRYGEQTILYFSNQRYDEKSLRKVLRPTTKRCYISSPELVVFEFQEEVIINKVKENIYPYIYKYCYADKEFSFIK